VRAEERRSSQPAWVPVCNRAGKKPSWRRGVPASNKAVELTASSVRSCLVPGSGTVQRESLHAPSDPSSRQLPLEDLERDARRALARLLPEADAAHVEVTRLVNMGVPYLKIVETATAESVDLIVMATHGRTGLRHLVLGSVAERVVRLAPCPVLTIRPPGGRSIGLPTPLLG
jgi:nucleotide-binding universal stress UspA family protein